MTGCERDTKHLVVFYGNNTGLLVENVLPYFIDGLSRGDSLVIITTPEHWQAFEQGIDASGYDVTRAVAEGAIVIIDAQRTLDTFMREGRPDRHLFDANVGSRLRELSKVTGVHICAYGEMVGILWEQGAAAAAIALEELWNGLAPALDFSLLCAYPIDVLEDFDAQGAQAVLDSHSGVVSIDRNGCLLEALSGGIAAALATSPTQPRARMPEAESTIVWLRRSLPAYADEIVAAAADYFQNTG